MCRPSFQAAQLGYSTFTWTWDTEGLSSWEVVEVVVVVWMGVAWSKASGRCEKNGELRRTIRDVCAWRSCELWTHPCQC